MIFVDTNVIMYAVGRANPLRAEAQRFFVDHVESGELLVSSAEVLQELMHAYVPVGRIDTLNSAFELAHARLGEIWAIESDDVEFARSLLPSYAALSARDLLHLAACIRRGVERVKTYDRALAAAFSD